MENEKEDVRAIVNDVILNFQAQGEWIKNVDPAFLTSLEVFGERDLKRRSKHDAFRMGIVIGAIYEQWKRR